jgi:hypothetical protein
MVKPIARSSHHHKAGDRLAARCWPGWAGLLLVRSDAGTSRQAPSPPRCPPTITLALADAVIGGGVLGTEGRWARCALACTTSGRSSDGSRGDRGDDPPSRQGVGDSLPGRRSPGARPDHPSASLNVDTQAADARTMRYDPPDHTDPNAFAGLRRRLARRAERASRAPHEPRPAGPRRPPAGDLPPSRPR